MRGRPNKAEQLQIERKLRPYFERMLSVSLASRETKININTVKKYYKVFSDEIKLTEHPDFIKKTKQYIQNCILAIDNQLSKLYKLQDKLEIQINSEIKQYGKATPILYKTSITLSKNITDLLFKKTDLIGISKNHPKGDHPRSKLLIPFSAEKEYETYWLISELCSVTRKDLKKDIDPRLDAKKEFNHPKDSMMSIIYGLVGLEQDTKWDWVSA